MHIADFEGVPGNFSKVRGGEECSPQRERTAAAAGQMFSSSKVKRQRNSLQVGLFLSWDNPKEREGCREVWSKIFDVNVKC